MSTLTYDRIKDCFVRQLESQGLVSLDTGRHKQLSDAVDSLAESLRRFITEEKPEIAAVLPKADPAASADEVALWLPEIALPNGWRFWQIPSVAHGAGRAVFPHYDVVEGRPVAGIAHIKLQTPDKTLIDIQFKPDDGMVKLAEMVKFTIDEFGKSADAEQLAVDAANESEAQ